MKKISCLIGCFIACSFLLSAQTAGKILYRKVTAMIPMRDGVKLFTTIFEPVNAGEPVPILLQRTPYGAERNMGKDSVFSLDGWTQMSPMTGEGYIFVIQDIRGKYKSEGSMQIHQPLV